MKTKYIFFGFIILFFAMFRRKPSILIPDLYLYDIKIQTNIKQNLIEKFAGKSQIFLKGFLIFFLDWLDLVQSFWAGPNNE
jgi:hypothetical protein